MEVAGILLVLVVALMTACWAAPRASIKLAGLRTVLLYMG
jgi:hypothetical protein